jgi:AcrR family transcriptional regulator
MSVSDKSIDGRLMECARKEFLEKGFEKASLRNICRRANVTTGALYKRFKGKEELFSAIVEDTADFIYKCLTYKDELSKQPQSEEFLVNCWHMSDEVMLYWFKVIMERKEPFTMLLRCSSGTKYQDFEHKLATNMSESNYRFYLQAYERGITRKKISKTDLHILDAAYWKAICEPFVHDYSWDEIVTLTSNICLFMDYCKLLEIDKGLIRKYAMTQEKIIKDILMEGHI